MNEPFADIHADASTGILKAIVEVQDHRCRYSGCEELAKSYVASLRMLHVQAQRHGNMPSFPMGEFNDHCVYCGERWPCTAILEYAALFPGIRGEYYASILMARHEAEADIRKQNRERIDRV